MGKFEMGQFYIDNNILLKQDVEDAAMADCPVLITGETGTGKELVAQAIHHWSKRSTKPFIPFNSSMNSTLWESKLCGFKKGSFTGSIADCDGSLKASEDGIIFFDEIGDAPLEFQMLLLRILSEREYVRIGDSKPQELKSRLIFATNADLEMAVNSEKIRPDFYYRIASGLIIELPPLRKRDKNEVIALFEFFSKAKVLSSRLENFLVEYEWPGNVRELKGFAEIFNIKGETRAIASKKSRSRIMINSLKSSIPTLEESERKLIMSALEAYNGDKNKVSEALGISLKTLYNKLNEYGFKEFKIISTRKKTEAVDKEADADKLDKLIKSLDEMVVTGGALEK